MTFIMNLLDNFLEWFCRLSANFWTATSFDSISFINSVVVGVVSGRELEFFCFVVPQVEFWVPGISETEVVSTVVAFVVLSTK